MAQVDAWMWVAAAAITGGATLSGVTLAQRSTRTLDREGRLWEKRASTYVEASRWLQSLLDVLPPDNEEGNPTAPVHRDPKLLAPIQLRAELSAYASNEVGPVIDRCIERAKSIAEGGPPCAGDGIRWSLREYVEMALVEIRDELQTGSFPSFTRWDVFVMMPPTLPGRFTLTRFRRNRTMKKRLRDVPPLDSQA